MAEYDVFSNLDELCNAKLNELEFKNIEQESAEDSFILNTTKTSKAAKTSTTLSKGGKRSKADKSVKKSKQVTPKPAAEISTAAVEKSTNKTTSRRSARLAASQESVATVEPSVNEDLSCSLNTTARGRGRGRGGRSARVTAQLESSLDEDLSCSLNTTARGRGGRRSTRGRGGRRSYRQSRITELLQTFSAIASMLAGREAALSSPVATPIPTPVSMPTPVPNQSSSQMNVMRARRRVVAERAARATTTDYVDLVSSPIVPVQGFVSLDSDDEAFEKEEQEKKKATVTKSLDETEDEENPELNVKVMWGVTIETLKLRKYQKFTHLMQKLADQHNCPMEHVVCNLNDRFILPEDTPASIDYKHYEFIQARATTSLLSSRSGETTQKKKQQNKNQISLKIQSDKWKRPLQVDLLKTDEFKILYIKCAEELNIARSSIKLTFDGEELQQNETPQELEFEGGEAIDLRITN